jgi:hypothetical protein
VESTTKERPMSTADTTIEAFANTRPGSAEALRDYAPIPRPAIGAALNEQGYYATRVKRHLFGVILPEAPAGLAELNVRLLAKTAKALDGMRAI